MKHLDLTGSTTVITGAANGMGADIARLLATHVVDLRDDDAVFAAAASIAEGHPRITALITCAG